MTDTTIVVNPQGPMGLRGLTGLQGPQGIPGTNGSNAAAGSQILTGSGVPSDGLGVNGDFYLRTSNGAYYKKAAGTWGASIGNLTGPAGSTGATGASGGAWITGSGVPSGGTGNNGDLYLRTSTGDVYQKSGGAWGSPIENIMGPTGSGSGDMLRANNLSDLISASTARTNLGLATVAATGAYADLSGRPSLATVATSGAYADVTGTPPAGITIAAIPFVIDGAGATITTGLKGYLEIPFACTINRATLLADQSGSIVVNVWKTTYSSFAPGTHPVVADKITASAPPTISSAMKAQDSTLSGWTTSVTAGDILAFNVDSCTTIQRVTLSLKVTKT